jgi:serine/threonine protein kinase
VAVPDVTLEHLLGGGSQGLVYAGRVRSTGLVVAVKVLHHDYVRGGSRAVREAEILARVRHRNVLRVFRVEQVGAFWVLIMEFLQGKDLAGTRLGADQARPCLVQLADAVRALGEGHIVHRDIKPANIVLRQGDSSPVLIDFGLALDLTAASAEDRAQVCGTPLFMTPDAFAGAAPEPSWDAYALGLTAVHLLGGDPIPYASTAWRTLVDAKVSGDFDRAVERCLDRLTDGPLRSWVAGLIGRDPAARLAALHEARRRLPAR